MAETREGKQTASRRRYWRREDAREAIGAWKRSGQTLSEFCRARGLQPRRMQRWLRRLEGSVLAEPTIALEPVRFHPVRLMSAGETSGYQSTQPIEIVLGDGCSVRVPPGFAAADLARVLQVLAVGAPC
jgi:hypothetical protein